MDERKIITSPQETHRSKQKIGNNELILPARPLRSRRYGNGLQN